MTPPRGVGGVHYPDARANDPSYTATVGDALAEMRRTGIQFEPAWECVLAEHPAPHEWLPVLPFMRRHFRSAYNCDASKYGRLRVAAVKDEGAVLPTPDEAREAA